MKATELLIKQHRLVEELFEQFEDADAAGEKREIFEKLAANLVGHDAIEREIFYPACERALGKEDDVLGESLVEHGVVEFSLYRADANRTGDDFDKYVTVLKEVVMHHVKEEEKELFPKVRSEMEGPQLEQLGAQMEKRFQEALQEDFREPLQENLEQVLLGRTKTQTKPPAKQAPTPGRGQTAARGKANARGKNHRGDSRAAKRRPSRTKR
jgi:hemerythrin superfamily protein